MSKKKTLLIAAGTLAVVGAFAGAVAQGRHGHWGGPMHHGMGGDEGFHGPRMGGFGDRFRGKLTKEDFDARARERFARIDKNSDGVLDAAEIEGSIGERRGWRGRMGKGDGAGMREGGRMGGRMMKRFDADKDGKVTAEEHAAGLRKIFAEMDLDNDGKITDADLPPTMRGRNVLAGDAAGPGRGFGRGMPMMRHLRGADADKDGTVTLDEFLAAARKRFATMDRNTDGAVDKADFDALRKEMTDYRVKRFVHHYGADKEGKVTREQFLAKAGERFAMMDTNADGSVTRNEMPGRGRWGGHHGGHRGHGMGGGHGMGSHDGRGPGPEGEGPGPRRGN